MSTKITAKMVGELREQTGAGMMDCKKALVANDGDFEAAIDELRKKGIASAAKKATRDAAEGIVGNYIHMGGKVGVLVEINCETDFVAKNDEFQEFVRDIAMHIAAAGPICVSREEVDPALVEKEKAIAADQFKDKPAAAVQKIVEGKMDKFYSTVALLEQSFVKDPDTTIQQLLTAKIAKLGENIIIRRFARFQVGA